MLADVDRICWRQNRKKVRRSEKGIEQEAIEPSQNKNKLIRDGQVAVNKGADVDVE